MKGDFVPVLDLSCYDINPQNIDKDSLAKLKALNDSKIKIVERQSLQYSVNFLMAKYSLTEENLKEWAEGAASCMKVHIARLIMALSNPEPLIVKAE